MLLLKIALLILVSGFEGANSLWTVSKVAVQNGGSITIPCHYHGMYRTNAKYWCKGRAWGFCTEIVRTTTKPRTEGVFITDYPSEQVFTITMTNLQVKDADRYWCAVKMIGFKPTIRTSLELQVTEDPPDLSVTEDRVSVEEGGNVSIPCLYHDKLKSAEKKWCESGNLHSCISALTMAPPQQPSVTIFDDGSGVFTVTLMKLERKDTGWYWCSAGGLQVPIHINVTERLDAFHNSTATTPGGVSVSSLTPGEQTTLVPTSEIAHRISSALPSLQPTKTSQGTPTAPQTTSPSLLTHTPPVKTSAAVTVTTSEHSTTKDIASSVVFTSLASTTSASVQSSTGTTGTYSTSVPQKTICTCNSTCTSVPSNNTDCTAGHHRHLIWQSAVIAVGIVMALAIIVGASMKCWHNHKHDHVRIALDDMTQELHVSMEDDLEEDITNDWPHSCLLYHTEAPENERVL